jgi:hypothetical protein
MDFPQIEINAKLCVSPKGEHPTQPVAFNLASPLAWYLRLTSPAFSWMEFNQRQPPILFMKSEALAVIISSLGPYIHNILWSRRQAGTSDVGRSRRSSHGPENNSVK